MTREPTEAASARRGGRTRSARPVADSGRRTRRRTATVDRADLTDEEVQALVDEQVDPDDMVRAAREIDVAEQEASDHDRDTPRDVLEGLLRDEDQ